MNYQKFKLFILGYVGVSSKTSFWSKSKPYSWSSQSLSDDSRSPIRNQTLNKGQGKFIDFSSYWEKEL
jgi:hypothetical protein